ncbi:glycosyltransferase family 2 protein [Micromonospora maris]|uniref:Glycosyl transferase n=1 Tax=Micromonospora maris TaxID=1003110 RepID=A0A9X0I1G6_9ACTN|nr:glycosyltransferase family 2 protein [Micromonospora maris]AEB45664.1 glycosyl transferase family 2 [Micromonospora maris AB-18-032]KUJ45014.1 glycosyl transferase [Micromonospora maris]
MSPARVTAVMLAYGPEPWLVDAAQAVLASTGVDVELIVVDNGCTSDGIDVVKGLPGVRVIRPEQNTGFSGGCNLGAAEAGGDWLAFVNSDAVVAPDALAKVTAVAAEPGVGAAMASIRLADNPELINTSGNPLHFTGLSWAGGNGEPAAAHARRTAVPSLSGCCFVISRERWEELGGFATEYFAYHEDTELSLRLWHRGLRLEYVPDAVVRHHYEFSRNALKLYLVERNRLVTLLTAYQGRTLALLAPMLLLTEAAMLAAALAGGWGRQKVRGWAWLWQHRTWVRTRRRQLQSERTVGDGTLAHLITARVAPSNVDAPPGMGVFNAIAAAWWTLVRPLLARP